MIIYTIHNCKLHIESEVINPIPNKLVLNNIEGFTD